MGVWILLAAVAAEAAFAVFCIATKSYQHDVKSKLRIAELAIFVLFTVFQVIVWSFRYYALAGLLGVLAIIGAASLIRKKETGKEFKAGRIVRKAIGLSALIFAAAIPAIIFPQRGELAPTGGFHVASAAYTYEDTNRVESYTDTGENRKLTVEFWYPADAEGKYPLVVFSHGSFGIRTSNKSLFSELASHGYVVCSIDHTYQSLFTTDEAGQTTLMDMGYMKEISSENARKNRTQSFALYQKWMKIRTDDISFVIDGILSQTKNDAAKTVYKLINAEKIGVMGHSLGGSAALGIGRLRGDVDAVIALEAPFLCDIEGVKDGEFVFSDKVYPVPVLNVYSDSSWSHLGEWPQYAQNNALLSGGNATAFNAHIKGALHLTLTDLARTSPALARMLNGKKAEIDSKICLKEINKLCLAFFDCYLKGTLKFSSITNIDS